MSIEWSLDLLPAWMKLISSTRSCFKELIIFLRPVIMVKARKRLKSNMVSGRLCYNTFLRGRKIHGQV